MLKIPYTSTNAISRLSFQGVINAASYRLLPGACLLCGLSALKHTDLCSSCAQSLPRVGLNCNICAHPLTTPGICGQCLIKRPAFSSVQVPLIYQYPVDQLLQRFKFSGQLAAGKVLTQILAQHIKDQVKTGQYTLPDLLIPVPLHWKKRFRRGFNQSDEIARELSRQLKVKCDAKVIKRVINTPAQHHLSRKQREHNPRRAFAVSSICNTLKGTRIALIDDVLTTGSTAEAVSQTLLKEGARSVDIWLLARTPLDK